MKLKERKMKIKNKGSILFLNTAFIKILFKTGNVVFGVIALFTIFKASSKSC